MNDAKEFATAYADKLGLAVFPAKGKIPAVPKVEGGRGCHDATRDAAQISNYWDRYPGANVAIATGKTSDVWVLDIDGDLGRNSLVALVSDHGPLPSTPRVTTGKGEHHYFKMPAGIEIGNRAGIRPGIDVRGTGGYVIAPPSIHPNGAVYTWDDELRPSKVPFADPPRWLLDLIVKQAAPTSFAAASDPCEGYVEAALKSETASVIKAARGQRNETLNRAAFSLGQLIGSEMLDRICVEDALWSASIANGLVGDDGEEATRNTMRSGIEAGMLQPREVPEPKNHETPGNGSGDLSALTALTAQEDWREPDLSVLNEGRGRPPALPLQVFGDLWSDWIIRTARSKNCPVDYVAASLLSTTASVIGNARWVSPWQGWREPCVVWKVMIGKSGASKSPATDPMSDIIKCIERDLTTDMDEKWTQYETRKEESKAIRDKWREEVKEAAKLGVAPPQIPDGAREPDKPERPRIRIADATPESLAYLLAANPKGLLFHRDELAGWFGSFDRYAGAGAERAMWIEAFGGREYIVDRVKNDGEPIRIPHLSISILGGLQPDRLASGLLSGDDDGLQARFLWFWPDPVPPERPADSVNDAAAIDAIRRLFGLQLVSDEEGHLHPVIVPFAEDGATELQKWRVQHHEMDAIGMFGSSMAKMPGYVVRLALLLEFLWWSVDGGPEPTAISNTAVSAAVNLVEDYFKPMAERVYGDAALPERERLATALARWIVRDRLQSFNARTARRSSKLPDVKTSTQMNMALEELSEAGWIQPSPTREGGGIGRRSSDFEVNPRLWELMK